MPLNPLWLPPTRYWQARLHPPEKDWVLSLGSLTTYLVALSDGDFRVRVVYQGWQHPRPDEQTALALPKRQWARIREVELVCRGEVYVTARSIIPMQALHGKGRQLRYLGSRSLGTVLFKSGGRREPPQVCREDRGWRRRSRFWFGGQPLLVQERFLPALFEAVRQARPMTLR